MKNTISRGVVINQAARSSAVMPPPDLLVVAMLLEQHELLEQHGPESQELAAIPAHDL
jgi:hypothetical protein